MTERFQSISQDEILDTETGLVWRRDDQANLTWYQAINDARSLGKEWKLPTIHELFTLVDPTKSDPATGFPDIRNRRFWSSSSCANHTDYAWSVYFGSYGSVSHCAKTGVFDIKYVRSRPTEKLVVPVRYNLSLAGRF